MMVLPERREEGLIITEVDDETLVYDLERHRAYCLNRTAALVWRHCDGQTTVQEAAGVIEAELGVAVDEALVLYALGRLDRTRLLRDRLPEGLNGKLSRRDFNKKLVLLGVAAFMVPTVISILAPAAAQAQTCIAVACGNTI